MREIKFRVWDKEDKKMRLIDEIKFDWHGRILSKIDDAKMQACCFTIEGNKK